MKKYFVLIMIVSGLFLTSCEKDEFTSQTTNPTNGQSTNPSDSTSKRSCGMDTQMKKLLSNPAYKATHEKKLRMVNSIVGLKAMRSGDVVLPMAVHFQGVTNPDVACLRALAQSQVNILNADYGGTNSDINEWENIASTYFPGINNGEGDFEFCLATKNHPSGYGLNNGDLAVTINQVEGDYSSDWSGYINIFVMPNTGFLGYSPLGGLGTGDGVVIDAAAFGSGQGCGTVSPGAPYDLGRTLTHELGHYLMLDHIWGDGCGVDDNVADTPESESSYFGCPAIGAASCGSTDMFMNYMDYTEDACMYMFSEGQVTRSTNYITTSLQNLTNNAANVCGGSTNTTTCTDGIQNGQETGVDCGGPDCEPCSTTSTCTDGIQNGQETGVDCGGPDCEPCGTTSGCDNTVGFEIVIDNYGSEITWELLNTEEVVLYSGGGDEYPDFEDGAFFLEEFCLVDGCYTLVVYDYWGDGICCDYGEGSFYLFNEEGSIAESDGEYGDFELVEFCIGENSGSNKVEVTKREKSAKVPSKIEAARKAKKK